nr:hypothetical protein [Acidobacteriota bacterium]
ILVFVQTLLVLGVVALLEQHPPPVARAAEGEPQSHRGAEATSQVPAQPRETSAVESQSG